MFLGQGIEDALTSVSQKRGSGSGLGDRIGAQAETFQNGDGIPRARQMLRTVLGNLSMTRHGGRFSGLSINVKAMLSSFAHELGSPDSQHVELNLFASCGAKGDFFATDFFSGNIFR